MKSDLKSIKLLAVDYLKLEPSVNEAYPFIVYHPFIDRNPVAFIENNKLVLIDIINDEENLNKYLKQKEADIMSAKNLDEMFLMITKPYRLLFFKSITGFLSKEDYNKYLRYIWTDTEFPNADVNIKPTMSLKLFEKSDKKLLMNSDELTYLEQLPTEVKIYRGTYSKNNFKALSWTDNYDTAKWFAKRFNGNTVIKSTINKNDIYAYLNNRNESELVINYNKIKNIEIDKIKDINI